LLTFSAARQPNADYTTYFTLLLGIGLYTSSLVPPCE